jgi:hypothetical protein
MGFIDSKPASTSSHRSALSSLFGVPLRQWNRFLYEELEVRKDWLVKDWGESTEKIESGAERGQESKGGTGII